MNNYSCSTIGIKNKRYFLCDCCGKKHTVQYGYKLKFDTGRGGCYETERSLCQKCSNRLSKYLWEARDLIQKAFCERFDKEYKLDKDAERILKLED